MAGARSRPFARMAWKVFPMRRAGARAFTVIELLVVVSIIALLVGILLPAIGKARDQARTTISQANLRNLSSAHAGYAAEWNDRQLTFCDDNASHYGVLGDWWRNYLEKHGADGSWEHPGNHPPIYLGWGRRTEGGYGPAAVRQPGTWRPSGDIAHCPHRPPSGAVGGDYGRPGPGRPAFRGCPGPLPKGLPARTGLVLL